jgi:DNA-binding transcriptional regulator YdaS (Cro superfamily)
MNAGGLFTVGRDGWHRVRRMYELRALRRSAGLGQDEFAALLSIPAETLRTWDSGRRRTPAPVIERAAGVVVQYQRQRELVPLHRWPRNSACTFGRCRPLRPRDDSRRVSVCGRPSGDRSAALPGPLANSFSRNTIAASVARPCVPYPCQPFPAIMISASVMCASDCD